MNPLLIGSRLVGVDMEEFAASLPGKLSKDQRRIRLFTADLIPTAYRVAAKDPKQLPVFMREAGQLVEAYANGLNPKKWSLANIFGRDPLYQARQDVRDFAKRWDMSPVFIEEMG